MARLPRPHIPLDVRCVVALRQLGQHSEPQISDLLADNKGNYGALLWYTLRNLASKLGWMGAPHLDHDPALENRARVHIDGEHVGYNPNANDPDFLIYREGGPSGGGSDHDIKTRVRGDRGQLSDHAIARKEKRRLRKLRVPKDKNKLVRWKWPNGRKLQGRNTLRKKR